MSPDRIEIGKTYRMSGRALDRKVIDIFSYPRGDPYVGEYQEVVVEIIGGKYPGRTAKEPLTWFASSAMCTVDELKEMT
jgi:hypothetical protein